MSNWTHDDIQTVIRLVREGKSVREVAEQFPNRTRNAVLGLIHRRGLSVKMLLKTPKGKTNYKKINAWSDIDIEVAIQMAKDGKSGQSIANALGKTRNAVIGLLYRKGVSLKTHRPNDAVLQNKVIGIPFAQLGPNQCQYPCKDGGFCGGPIFPNQYKRPYCSQHLVDIYDNTGKRRIGEYQKNVMRQLEYAENRPLYLAGE